jgi:predicted nucleic acid-binding protein
MKISLDTSVIVDLERGKLSLRQLDKYDVFISSVVAAEIFTGTHLRRDSKKVTSKARNLLSLFEVVPFDFRIAEIAGRINAYLISNGFPVEFEDVVIAATFLQKKGDVLVTNNVRHFNRIPEVSEKVVSVSEFFG